MSIERLRTLNKVVGVMSLFGWLLYMIALSMFHYARPEPENFYDSVLGNTVNPYWNPTYVDLFLGFAAAGMVLSIAALALNVYLYRARRTHIWLNLIILILALISTVALFLWSFD